SSVSFTSACRSTSGDGAVAVSPTVNFVVDFGVPVFCWAQQTPASSRMRNVLWIMPIIMHQATRNDNPFLPAAKLLPYNAIACAIFAKAGLPDLKALLLLR